MSQILDEVLSANRAYAASFGARSELALPPARGFAILTCMDARLDPAKYAGLAEGDAHVIRNAGGRASDDAIRSLVISYKLLGTREWFVIHHTDCGMQGEFNRSSQHLHQGGGHGTTTGMDQDGDRQGSDAFAGASATAARGRARVLETDRHGCRQRGRRDGDGCVAARRVPVVPSGWRHVTDPSGRAVRPLPVVR